MWNVVCLLLFLPRDPLIPQHRWLPFGRRRPDLALRIPTPIPIAQWKETDTTRRTSVLIANSSTGAPTVATTTP